MMTGVGPRQGFVYVSVVDSTAMAKAEAGRTVRIPGRGPPWIAVDHELSSVVVARWPGRLWAVEIVDAVTAQDGAGGLRADAGYTRAAAVKILHAVPVAALFGAHGAEVCAVIEAAAKLDLAGAERLAEMRHPGAGDAQNRVWRRWLVRENIPLDRYNDLDGTLAVGASKAGSPIGKAPRMIHSMVGRRAEALAARPCGLWTRPIRKAPGSQSRGVQPASPCSTLHWHSVRLTSLSARTTIFLLPRRDTTGSG